MVLRGSADVLPSHSRSIRSGDIEVLVGAPIQVAGRDRDEVMEEVRRFMLDELSEASGRAPARLAAGAS
jgi:hypothetical protein